MTSICKTWISTGSESVVVKSSARWLGAAATKWLKLRLRPLSKIQYNLVFHTVDVRNSSMDQHSVSYLSKFSSPGNVMCQSYEHYMRQQQQSAEYVTIDW
jgi:hypothetical protein